MSTFELPFAMDPFTISLLWHPRLDGDPAHRWLRACVKEAVATAKGRTLADAAGQRRDDSSMNEIEMTISITWTD